MLTEKQKLIIMAELGVELSRIQDLDILMQKILNRSRHFLNADAGSIYIKEDRWLHFTYTQNDTLQSRLKPGEKLIYSTYHLEINEENIAGYVAATGKTLNIPDVYNIDPLNPYHFTNTFDIKSCYRTQSMLTIPLKRFNGGILGVLQVINARDAEGKIVAFSADDEKMMSHFAGIAAVALERAKMTRAILLRMIRMAEIRDPKETGAHVNRVAGYAIELYEGWARRHGHTIEEIDQVRDILRMAAMLHDVGKVGISDLILKKPGRFTPEEYEIMKEHTVLGARLFIDRQSDFDDAAIEVALNHHERWDGNGYPGHVDYVTGKPLPGKQDAADGAVGKKGEEIPLFGRIVAIADVYDALCSSRVYKEAWDENEVLTAIKGDSGTHFDPELVAVFFENIESIHAIRDRYKDEGVVILKG